MKVRRPLTEYEKTLYTRLHEARLAAGMSRAQAADALNVTRVAIYNWETHRYGTSIHHLLHWAALFNFTLKMVPRT